MAFRLSKGEMKQRDEHVETLNKAKVDLEAAISDFNNAMVVAKTPLEKAIADYNEAVAAAKGFAEDIASQADSDISDKSDKWQEGDRGQAASEWKGEWESIDLDDVSVDLPEELDVPDLAHADNLEALPEGAQF